MPDINLILSSSDHYKQAFEEGLTGVLLHKTAGTFILACANLFQHPNFLTNNKALLHDTYSQLKDYYRACRHKGLLPQDAPDDIAVMNSLIDIGLDNLEEVAYRKVSHGDVDYLLNYNQLRSFRPARMSKTENLLLNNSFNPEGFHFAKPFLEKEIFAEGYIDGKQLSLLYNKFPFIDYHALLVVDKTKHNNQFLTHDYLDYIVNLQRRTQQQCPDFVIAYNSLGAGASVNHLHFHCYLENRPLTVFSKQLCHNGGDQPYPASCRVFNNPNEAWQTIDTLHTNNTPYNLLIKNNRIYCLPRKLPATENQNTQIGSIETSLYGWSQMAGLIYVASKQSLAELTPDQVISSLESVSALINSTE